MSKRFWGGSVKFQKSFDPSSARIFWIFFAMSWVTDKIVLILVYVGKVFQIRSNHRDVHGPIFVSIVEANGIC